MSRSKGTVVKSIGPVKTTPVAKGAKEIKPAWTGMFKPPVSNVSPTTKSYILPSDEETEIIEDQGDFSRKYGGKGFSGTPEPSRSNRQGSGFSLRESLNALNVETNESIPTDVDNMFNERNRMKSATTLPTGTPHTRSSVVLSPGKTYKQTFGPRDPNITNEFEKFVLSGSYMNFSDIVVMLGHCRTREEGSELVKRDILIWLDCFMLYMDIIGSVSPGRISSLTRYIRVIMWIYKESKEVTAWWRYDVAYRRTAAIKGNLL